jgi:hypothetical protein
LNIRYSNWQKRQLLFNPVSIAKREKKALQAVESVGAKMRFFGSSDQRYSQEARFGMRRDNPSRDRSTTTFGGCGRREIPGRGDAPSAFTPRDADLPDPARSCHRIGIRCAGFNPHAETCGRRVIHAGESGRRGASGWGGQKGWRWPRKSRTDGNVWGILTPRAASAA